VNKVLGYYAEVQITAQECLIGAAFVEAKNVETLKIVKTLSQNEFFRQR
jgi:hypothetical protein